MITSEDVTLPEEIMEWDQYQGQDQDLISEKIQEAEVEAEEDTQEAGVEVEAVYIVTTGNKNY